MRVLFAGSPAIAVPSLNAIFDLERQGNGVSLAGILTNPDSPRGRRGILVPTDVSAAALELDKIRMKEGYSPIPQLKPAKLNARAREEVTALSPDLLVTFAYGRIFGPRFLSLFPLGGINIHPSLLPKFRGASPISSAILAGDTETGICVQKLAPEMDTGDILALERLPIAPNETTGSLSEKVSIRAASLLVKVLLDYKSLAIEARLQEGEAVYCREIKKEEGLIDLTKSAVEIDAQIRAFTPWPLCYTSRENEKLFILEALPLDAPPENDVQKNTPGTVIGQDKNHGILIQTGRGILAVKKLQWQAKKALDWKSFCNGARDFIGSKLA